MTDGGGGGRGREREKGGRDGGRGKWGREGSWGKQGGLKGRAGREQCGRTGVGTTCCSEYLWALLWEDKWDVVWRMLWTGANAPCTMLVLLLKPGEGKPFREQRKDFQRDSDLPPGARMHFLRACGHWPSNSIQQCSRLSYLETLPLPTTPSPLHNWPCSV